MSKNIKVTDEIYARLEEQAKRGYRPITSHLEFLLDYFEAGEKNKNQNPEKFGSQANNQRPNGEHMGRREAKSEPQLLHEINLIKQRYAEEAEFCQDQEQLKNLQRNMDAEIAPIQAEIDRLSKA